MLCDQCQTNQATIHMTQVINGVKEEKHFCEDCAKENGMAFGGPISFQDLFQGFLNTAIPGTKQAGSDARCPTCGLSFEELRKGGKLGCAACFDAFRPQLENTLKSIHGGTRHKGKLGKQAGADLLAQRELAGLKQQLNAAVMEEDFEEAARLRDAIRALEKGA